MTAGKIRESGMDERERKKQGQQKMRGEKRNERGEREKDRRG